MTVVTKQIAQGTTLHAWLSFASNNFATIGLSLLFGVVGLVWFSGSSSKESDSRALPVSLVEHRKPELVSVNIEEIQLGDYVLAKDPITGEVDERKVLQTFARISDHLRVLTLRSESGEEQTISTTDEHPFFIEGNHERKAGDLSIGDKVVQADGQFAVLIDTHREERKAGVSVYNFEVEGFHTYFVSAQGARAPPIWVHNASYAPKRVYKHFDEAGGVNYIGITDDLKRRARQHKLDEAKTGHSMKPATNELTHDQARTIEAMVIRQKLAEARAKGLIDGTEPVKAQLEKAGLLNKNRGRDPSRWLEIDPDDFIEDFDDFFDIRTLNGN